ncbi:MAG TPA: hypothetical protein VKZ87_06500 [Ferrovibrio sp.]|jgi:hypothetical protein|uniref:hypothetical protein n=1 Tax=Ferrovibrio sp. TaxID=1917215 RepID=UPI000DB0ACE9|nr:hypothetical protein [Ferrovibrio sp.]PZN20566.1 MAG: hypothetical protein DIU80_20085 [Chloroflexota bacterium]HLT77018.1 hypothetical protein [Ferrovibrio sp.]
MNAFVRGLAVLGIAVLAAACSSAPERLVLPEITFEDQPKLTFAASAVETLVEYQPTAQPPHIELNIPQPPQVVAQRWARDRVALDNTQQNTVRVIIRKASVTETDLRKTPGLRGSFTEDQIARFDTDVEMAVQLHDARGFRLAEASASARRSNSISEKATLNDRDRVLHDLVRETLMDVNRELERNIRQYMPLYVR